MKMERGWFWIGSGLVLSFLFFIVLSACNTPLIQVTVNVGPEAMKDKDIPPTGCKRMPDGSWKC